MLTVLGYDGKFAPRLFARVEEALMMRTTLALLLPFWLIQAITLPLSTSINWAYWAFFVGCFHLCVVGVGVALHRQAPAARAGRGERETWRPPVS